MHNKPIVRDYLSSITRHRTRWVAYTLRGQAINRNELAYRWSKQNAIASYWKLNVAYLHRTIGVSGGVAKGGGEAGCHARAALAVAEGRHFDDK